MADTFLSIGECMVEMAPTAAGLYRMGFAGDTLNTAWYARRLLSPVWRVAYLTAAGTDAPSDQMVDFLAAAGIDTRHVARLSDRTLGLYLIQLEHGERSFSYWRSHSAARCLARHSDKLATALAEARLAYFSGITLAILEPEDRARLLGALAAARRRGCRIAFDSNLRTKLWSDRDAMTEGTMQAAAVADIALPSFEDEAACFGDADPEATAARYAAAGASLVVVKNGAGDVAATDNGRFLRFPVPPIARVVDTTAAGDSFNAAFLAEYLATGDVAAAIRSASTLAGRVIGQRGALLSDWPDVDGRSERLERSRSAG